MQGAQLELIMENKSKTKYNTPALFVKHFKKKQTTHN